MITQLVSQYSCTAKTSWLQRNYFLRCVLCDLIPKLLQLCLCVFQIFVRQLIELLVNRYRRNYCIIPKITSGFCLNWSGQNGIKDVIPMMNSDSHVCISEVVKVSSYSSLDPCMINRHWWISRWNTWRCDNISRPPSHFTNRGYPAKRALSG